MEAVVADINEFQLFHTYLGLVREGKAKPILCPFCEHEFIVSHENGDLRLSCYTCDTKIVPGFDTVSNVKAVVKEHVL
jgi:hypothetical protein